MPAYAPVAVGSIATTMPNGGNRIGDPKLFTKDKYLVAWTADGSGNVIAQIQQKFNGEIASIVTDPTTVGTTYAIAINNEHGIDVLNATGTARSTTANEFLAGVSGRNLVDDQCWLTITGAGAGSKGNVWIYVKHQ